MRMERFTRPLMAQLRRAHHHRQGRPGPRLARGVRASSAASISRSSAAPRRSRRRGSRRSRTSISTTSIPRSLWKFRVRDFGPLLVAMDSHGGEPLRRRRRARRATGAPHALAALNVRRVDGHRTADHRRPDPRRRRRGTLRGAARARRSTRRSTSRSPSRDCSASAAARGWSRAATTSRSRAGDSVERHFMDTIEGGKWLPEPGSRVDAVSAAPSSASTSSRTSSAASSIAIRTARSTRRHSPGRRSIAPCTRAT